MSNSDYTRIVAHHGFITVGSLRVLVHRKVEVPLAVDGEVLQRVASERWAVGSRTGLEHPRFTSWIVLQRGRLHLEGGGESVVVEAGSLIALPRTVAYRLLVEGRRDAELTIWRTLGGHGDAWFRDIGAGGPTVIRLQRRHEMERCLEELIDRMAADVERERHLAWRYHQLVIALAALDRRQTARVPSRADARAERCRELIEARGLRIPSAGALAAELGLHPDYLARIYRARFGVSPAEHLRRARMVRACERLRAGASLDAIATELGFADGFSLSKAFKAWSGLPPQRWRQQLGG